MSLVSKINSFINRIAQDIKALKEDVSTIKNNGGGGEKKYQLNTEIDTGDYWIDGKKIYKKIFFYSNSVSSLEVSTAYNITSNANFVNSVSSIIGCCLLCLNTKSSGRRIFMDVHCNIDQNATVIKFWTPIRWANLTNIYLILTYTKDD